LVFADFAEIALTGQLLDPIANGPLGLIGEQSVGGKLFMAVLEDPLIPGTA